uniref:Solute carrier family 15 member 1 n=1 Tax=Sphenodon punctatus TaxID=8508 RepID=A0A8D0GK57_SPHPU
MCRGGEGSKEPSCFGYPISIFFIVINEFCERFSYYGMRAVLVLYFHFFLRWDDTLSTIVYHTFVAVCYMTPVLGAVIADSWLGKFKTIISLSIVYTVGQVIMAISSINDLTDANRDGTPDNFAVHISLSLIGLLLIALGTGGIKPCVAAFGGDQFEEHQEKQRNRFFSIFYLAVNAGSLISTIITPIFRGEQCGIHTKQQCYPLAFGVPAALMAVSLVVFIAGSKMYKKVEPQGNVLVQVSRCIGFAIKNREHWLDWASEKYSNRLLTQTKMVLRVLFLYIPLPMFWALFDQQGSRWTLQATTMDGDFGAIQIQPDQMQTVNPILIVVMVPIVDAVVYPLIKKCRINFTPLKRMTVGMFLAAMAFVAAALVQIQIDVVQTGTMNNLFPNFTYYRKCESNNYIIFGLFRFINNLNSTVNITLDGVDFGEVNNFSATKYEAFKGGKKDVFVVVVDNLATCNAQTMRFGYGSAYTIIISGVKLGYIEDIKPNTVHMALQIPQYFIITCAEVVFSVTGLSFSYSQAPANMKSVLQAGWLMTVAVGNIIVLIVAGASKLSDQWAEYILFAALLLAVGIIFAIMAYFYTYVDPAEVEAQLVEEEEKKKKEKEGYAFENGAGPVSDTDVKEIQF